MDFNLTDDQLAILQAVQDFTQQEIQPFAAEWDKNHHFPQQALRRAAELGFAGLYAKTDRGGTGLDRLASVLVFMTIAEACVSTAAYLSIHNMVVWMIDSFGTAEQRQAWLPSLLTMKQFASYCLTEPNAGSDAASLTTTAKRDGDHYIVNGCKAFISGGSTSGIYIVMVRTGEPGPHGISCLLIDGNSKGLRFGTPEQKLGWHSQTTTMIYFDDCRVPVTNRLGDEGQGFKMALTALNGGRLNLAACSLGGARACLRYTKQYVSERRQFDQALQDMPTIQFQMADLLTELEAAKLLTFQAANKLQQNQNDAPLHCAMAKRYASDAAFHIADRCLQLYGGYGYLQDYPIERYFRDLRVHSILEGSNEIMRLIIARHLFAEGFDLF